MQRRYQRLTLRIIINYVEIMREQLDKRDFFLEGELKWEKIKTRASVLLPSSVLVSLLYTSEDVSVEDKKGQGIIHFSRCDTLLFFFYLRFDSASGKVGALLSRTSVSHFGSRKGWSEVPCTRLDKETDILPTSSRTHSVPIIPSLQASDLSVGNVEVSEQKHRGLLKWHLVQAGKQAVHVTNSLAQSRRDTAAPKPSVMPGDVSPPAPSAGTTAPPASQENPNSAQRLCSAEITVETPRELKHKSFPSSMEKSGSHSEIHRGATNTPGNGSAHGSDGRSVHTSFGSRVLKAVGQRETQGRCQGQASLEYGGANLSSATRGASCRGSGNGVAKPPAS